MNVFYTKTYNLSGKNAEKQNNIATVAKKMGFEEISFFKFEDQSDSDRELNVRMDGILAAVEENAVVIFQYPSMVSSRYDRCAIEHIRQSKDRKLILMVQDLGDTVDPKDYPMLADEIELFQQADLLILQSVKMKDFLVEHGLGEVPVVYQRVWEYPYEIYNDEVQVEKRLQTIEDISIPALLDLQTGGVAVLEKKDDFYEAMGNPLETGFCICAGIPILANEASGLGTFVSAYGIGFVIRESEDAEAVLQKLTEEQIADKTERMRKMKEMAGNGWFTRTLLQNAVFQVLEKQFRV